MVWTAVTPSEVKVQTRAKASGLDKASAVRVTSPVRVCARSPGCDGYGRQAPA